MTLADLARVDLSAAAAKALKQKPLTAAEEVALRAAIAASAVAT